MVASRKYQVIAAVCFFCALSISIYDFFDARYSTDIESPTVIVASEATDSDIEPLVKSGSFDTEKLNNGAGKLDTDDLLEAHSLTDNDIEANQSDDVEPVKPTAPVTKSGESQTILCVSSGDTLMSMLIKCGIERGHAHAAIKALSKKFNPRRLKIGQEINLVTSQIIPQRNTNIVSIEIETAPDSKVCLQRLDGGGFLVEKKTLSLTRKVKHVSGKVATTFYSAVRKSGVPASVTRQAVNALASEVNLRHAKPGDKFELIYAVKTNEAGQEVKVEGLDYVAFAPGGKLSRMYRFKPKGCVESFYNHKGQALSNAKMLVPLRTKYVISSRFGYRRDPFVRSVRKFHSGVDFAVPRGTPIYAAANGVVKTAAWHGGYGKFVKIKHVGNISTAYGHLSKILVKAGQLVKKGQLIGKVGSTGRSTNPHLHFEVRRGSKRVNPLKNVSLPARSLTGRDKKRFNVLKNAIMRRAEGIPSRTEVVATSAP